MEAAGRKTLYSIIVAIVVTPLAYLPASIAVFLYSWYITPYFEDSLIPFLSDVGAVIMPEVFRGAVTGFSGIYAASKLFKLPELMPVRIATSAFWSAILMFVLLIAVAGRGVGLQEVAAFGFLVGLNAGIWLAET
ncbi:hypothetical protein GE300_20135 [Rhodobacteraceae bacterium 2CG4]|uniref:Uncharacterized protein n=1 Tax=Halovulum marinum TaxID=2662447 RepID=A0A6L5Z768_9RHOB|nr:hypothetical protein [Halovulum marinum]MSU91885.1 hypothetical protein [Halovulum marinum]